MICRPEGNGWLFVTQATHAWMSGELAAAWGNDEFAAPEPRDAVLLATRLHDIGWLGWDAAPRLDRSGQPVDFLDTTLDDTIPIWRQAVQQVGLLNPFAALLVCRHAMTIYRRRLERGADPPDQRAKILALLDEQESSHEAIAARLSEHPLYRTSLGEERLKVIYRWLRTCDLFSLVLLSSRMPSAGVIEAVPGNDWGELRSIHYVRQDPFTLLIDPSPFGTRDLRLKVDVRRYDRKTFTDEARYHAALSDATWQQIDVTIATVPTGVPGPSDDAARLS